MTGPGIEQIRSFRLHSHHLDAVYPKDDMERLAGACGMLNTPPGVWETAMFNRAPDSSLADMERWLYEDKTLVQAWSLRGVPALFPVSQSPVFLSALVPEGDEPWIYTRGITGALDFLKMDFQPLLELLRQVMPCLDHRVIVSKATLDQTLADWMLPMIPADKRGLWNQPSMYGSPDRQTVGGAVVSFLLRPCAFCGLVVFGKRDGISPTFISYKNWTGQLLKPDEGAPGNLVRHYLHCYGPSGVDGFVNWLGCSGKQGRRLWNLVSGEMEPVMASGKKMYILSDDRERLFAPPSFEREMILLGGHDPYLDQRDRAILQQDPGLQKKIWRLSANPGAVVCRGEVVGIWTGKKKGKGMEIQITLWKEVHHRQGLLELAEQYAGFRQQKLVKVGFQ